MRRRTAGIVGLLVAAGLLATGEAQEPAEKAASNLGTARPTCTTSGCHSQVMQHERLHEPVAGNRCQACHKPKPSATPYQDGPRHEFKRAGDNPELCYVCHDRVSSSDHTSSGGIAFLHEPVKMGVCVLCHDPHGANDELFLRVDTDRQLCARCHRVAVDQGDHVHPPVGEGTCGACHHAHGSNHRNFVRSIPPELCLDCHDEIEELLEDASVTHDAVTTGTSCLGCHDPHASSVEALLLGEPMGLCLSCHDEELDSDEGKIGDIAQHLRDNPNHHGPIRDRNCLACHNPHGGAIRRLLTEAYPAGPYVSFDEDAYALCLGCHDIEMVEEERDEEVTEFRNGDLNLHYVHVNRQDKGCTCTTCHDVHASKGDNLIAGSTVFGGKTILIKYRPSDTGGTCSSSCHEEWAYDRVQPIRNE